MDRQEHEAALQAANVALAGRRRQEAKSLASIELKTQRPRTEHWELLGAAAAGLLAVAAVITIWFY